MSIKNFPQGPLLCSTCMLPFPQLPHSCLCFLPKSSFLEPAEASASFGSLPWGPLGQLHHSCGGGAARCKQALIPRPPQEKFDPQSPLGPQGLEHPWPGCHSGPGGSGLCHLQAMLIAWHLCGSCHITQPSLLMSHPYAAICLCGFQTD